MKKIFTMMTMLLTAHAVMAAAYMTNVWAEVQAYPTGAGKVYVTSNDLKPLMESGWGEVSSSKFTIGANNYTSYYRVENGNFVPFYIPCYFGIVQADGGEDYDCVGLVKQIREDGNYTDEDYFQGGPAVYDKNPVVLMNTDRSTGDYGRNLSYVGMDGVYVDVNSGRDGEKYDDLMVIPGEECMEIRNSMSEEDFYWFIHDMTAAEGFWPEVPTKIYALFEKKVSIEMPAEGQIIFSSKDNLKIQQGSGLEAYVVYKVENGIGKLKAVNSIPANVGVVLKGEPGKEYKFDRIPDPKKLIVVNASGTKTYNALLCDIFGFYPEDEILYRFGNYDYGLGFYKVPAGQQPDNSYLTMAIPGGPSPDFFILEGFATGITQTTKQTCTPTTIYDLQGRRLTEAPQKGVYIREGKKIVQ